MYIIIITRRGFKHRAPFLEKGLLMDGWRIFSIYQTYSTCFPSFRNLGDVTCSSLWRYIEFFLMPGDEFLCPCLLYSDCIIKHGGRLVSSVGYCTTLLEPLRGLRLGDYLLYLL